jgi:hypothetical protein
VSSKKKDEWFVGKGKKAKRAESLIETSKARDAIGEKIKDTLKEGGEEYVDALEPILASMVGLVQIATAGRVESVEDLLNSPENWTQKLLDSDKSLLLSFLEAQALAGALTPVDDKYAQSHRSKLEYMKLLKDLIQYEENRKVTRQDLPGPITGGAARYKNELLQELDEDSEEAGPEGDK